MICFIDIGIGNTHLAPTTGTVTGTVTTEVPQGAGALLRKVK